MSRSTGGIRLFASVVASFVSSAQFQKLSSNTKNAWGRELREAAHHDNLGIFSTREIRPSLVQKYLDGLDGRPGKQALALAALRACNKWARVRDHLPQSILEGVTTGRSAGGHVPWTEAQVIHAEKYARPDLARAITLGAHTGQRGSDLVRMAWSDITKRKGYAGINVTQQKTGKSLWIPIDAHLAAALKSWGRDVGPILLNRKGQPWTAIHLRQTWDYEKKINDKLAEHLKLGLVLHGLRGHRCVQLARGVGVPRPLTASQIGKVVGMSVRMVEGYTRLSDQEEDAITAMFGA